MAIVQKTLEQFHFCKKSLISFGHCSTVVRENHLLKYIGIMPRNIETNTRILNCIGIV